MSHRTNRRRFLQASAGSSIGLWMSGGLSAQEAKHIKERGGAPKSPSASPAIPVSRGVVAKFWIDPTIAAWRPGPWRKVHIEFHNSRHVPKLGERFNAEEFGVRL